VEPTAPEAMMDIGFFFWPYTPEYTARIATLGDELGFGLVGIADTLGMR
jgi:hypothetical protein